MTAIARRLSIPLDDDQHQLIKLTAFLNGQSIKDYVLGKIFSEKTPNADTLQAMADLEKKNNLRYAKTVDEMFEKILNPKSNETK